MLIVLSVQTAVSLSLVKDAMPIGRCRRFWGHAWQCVKAVVNRWWYTWLLWHALSDQLYNLIDIW